MVVKEGILSIKDEIRKMNRHLLEENKRNDIQTDCLNVASRNSFSISKPCKNILEAENFIDDYDKALSTVSPSAPSLSQDSSLNSIQSTPSASQINDNYFLQGI